MKKINTTSIKRTLALDSYTDRDRDLLIDRIIPKFMKTFEKELKGRDFPARNMPVLFMNEVDSLRGALSESNSETVSQGKSLSELGTYWAITIKDMSLSCVPFWSNCLRSYSC